MLTIILDPITPCLFTALLCLFTVLFWICNFCFATKSTTVFQDRWMGSRICLFRYSDYSWSFHGRKSSTSIIYRNLLSTKFPSTIMLWFHSTNHNIKHIRQFESNLFHYEYLWDSQFRFWSTFRFHNIYWFIWSSFH